MVEEIITALSRIRWLFVLARNSSFTYKGQAVDVKQVGRELGVRYVLEGSVRKGGNRVRITGQLIDAATGAHLWADRFDGPLEDIFELQDKVASSVAGVMAVVAIYALLLAWNDYLYQAVLLSVRNMTVSVTQGQLFTDNDAPWNAMMARPLPPAPRRRAQSHDGTPPSASGGSITVSRVRGAGH
jgi:hypothetical protein